MDSKGRYPLRNGEMPYEQVQDWNLGPQEHWYGGGNYYRGPLDYMVQEGALGIFDPVNPHNPRDRGSRYDNHVDGWQTLENGQGIYRCDYCGGTTRNRQEFMAHIKNPH
jgi:hypothetical protein